MRIVQINTKYTTKLSYITELDKRTSLRSVLLSNGARVTHAVERRELRCASSPSYNGVFTQYFCL